MNKSIQNAEESGLPIVKAFTFRKMISMLESLLSLDFRGYGIQVIVDNESLSADLCIASNPYKRKTLTFSVASDGSLLVLGNGHAENLQGLNIPELSMILERFVTVDPSEIN